jgi:hypothetical protein
MSLETFMMAVAFVVILGSGAAENAGEADKARTDAQQCSQRRDSISYPLGCIEPFVGATDELVWRVVGGQISPSARY